MRMPALRAAFGRFAESPAAMISLAITLVMLFAAIFAPLLAPTDPYDLTRLQLADALKPVGSRQLGPAEEARVSIHVGAGPAEATGPGTVLRGVSAVPCGEGCVELAAVPPDVALASLQIRNLPRGAGVDQARKHPVQPWWTVTAPAGPVRITGLTGAADIQVIAKSLPQETGLTFYLGTDGFGRDMLSAILYGIRISLTVGLVTAATAMVLGTGLGLVAAWRGGVADALIMRAVDFMLGFPALLVGLVVLALLGSGVDKVIFAIVLVQWCYYARTTRSVALGELGKEYVEAARVQRLSQGRILLRHILPNCLPQIIVLFTLNIAAAIALESSLSFLGIGLPLTKPSLGMLIANGYEYIFSHKYWISIYPGLVLLVMIVALNLLGDRLRDLNNPRLDR
ncbi:ABC transporter permease [Acuticoccus sediminis]|nr:ABC transporter permease [Acuticoccus sediminis]